jgi:hypothetical protein
MMQGSPRPGFLARFATRAAGDPIPLRLHVDSDRAYGGSEKLDLRNLQPARSLEAIKQAFVACDLTLCLPLLKEREDAPQRNVFIGCDVRTIKVSGAHSAPYGQDAPEASPFSFRRRG